MQSKRSYSSGSTVPPSWPELAVADSRMFQMEESNLTDQLSFLPS